MPFEIPDSWEWTRFGQVIVLLSGTDFRPDEYNDKMKGIPYITGASSLSLDGVIVNRWTESPRVIANRGDVLLVCKGSGYGKTVICDIEEAHIARQIMAIKEQSLLDMQYVRLFLQANCDQIKSKGQGVIPGIDRDSVMNLLFPLPPLNEQHKIANRIAEVENLLSSYDLVEHKLSSLQNSFPEQLKKSILQMAVQGKLVPQNPTDEPASVLLERIRAEKQRLIAEGKIKRDKHESVIFRRDNSHYEKLGGIERCIDDEIPFDIPDTWAWSRLGSLVQVITSGSRDWARFYSKAGKLFLRMGNLSRNSFELRLNNLQRVQLPEKTEGTRTSLQAGDLLFSITGEVGMLGLIPDGFESAYINQHTAMIRFLPLMRNKYLPYFLLTDYAQKCYKSNQHGIKNSFRLDSISDILVPIPPLCEQRRIITRIEATTKRIATM